jgi:hypothetical protein
VASAPTNPSFREINSDNQLWILNNSLEGKTLLLWGLDSVIWEAADKYGIDYNLLRTCLNDECNFAKEHETCIGDEGLAIGRAQFHRITWESNCVGDYRTATERDQIFCMANMWSEGKQEEWTCYRKLIRTLGDKI